MTAAGKADRERLARLVRRFRVDPGARVRLDRDHDPGSTAGLSKDDADRLLAEGIELLSHYQSGSPPRTRGACWWCCRGSTRLARTAPSATSCPASIRRV